MASVGSCCTHLRDLRDLRGEIILGLSNYQVEACPQGGSPHLRRSPVKMRDNYLILLWPLEMWILSRQFPNAPVTGPGIGFAPSPAMIRSIIHSESCFLDFSPPKSYHDR